MTPTTPSQHFLNGSSMATSLICGGQLIRERKWALGILSLACAGYWLWRELQEEQA